MGRNGMGKTTTVRSITRMLRTTRGEIRFDGADLTRCRPSGRRGSASGWRRKGGAALPASRSPRT
jgi:ABC-type branched-subunit amino acid transport system ATPase component